MTKSEELVHYLTEEGLAIAEKAIREEKEFTDEFDEWLGVVLPKELGGETWDINISVYGEPYMRGTAYPVRSYEHEGQTVTEMDTSAGVALFCLNVNKVTEEE